MNVADVLLQVSQEGEGCVTLLALVRSKLEVCAVDVPLQITVVLELPKALITVVTKVTKSWLFKVDSFYIATV